MFNHTISTCSINMYIYIDINIPIPIPIHPHQCCLKIFPLFPGLAVTPQHSPHLGPSSAVGPSVSPVASSAPDVTKKTTENFNSKLLGSKRSYRK